MIESIIFLFFIGIIAGILGALIGIGGGIITIPALTLLGLPPYVMSSSSLIGVVATSISSTITYSKKKLIDYTTGYKIGIITIPTSILGAFLAREISLIDFKFYFAIILLTVAIYIVFKDKILLKNKDNLENTKDKRRLMIYPIAIIGGLISSLFGIGGGIVFVPLLILILDTKMKIASPTSQFILLFSSVTGLTTHMILGHPDYIYGIILAIGSAIGAQFGVRLLTKVKETTLTLTFAIFLIIIAIKFFLETKV
ncbi:MAG: permease [Nitrososphaeraceae archaeon]|nr:permease [Nitrososphaeraceae archaeon]